MEIVINSFNSEENIIVVFKNSLFLIISIFYKTIPSKHDIAAEKFSI